MITKYWVYLVDNIPSSDNQVLIIFGKKKNILGSGNQVYLVYKKKHMYQVHNNNQLKYWEYLVEKHSLLKHVVLSLKA